MKRTLLAIACAAMITNSPQGISTAWSAEASFEQKMSEIEDRARMLRLVIKKLKRSFMKARKDHEFMKAQGMSEADIERLEKAYRSKLRKLINAAIAEINAI